MACQSSVFLPQSERGDGLVRRVDQLVFALACFITTRWKLASSAGAARVALVKPFWSHFRRPPTGLSMAAPSGTPFISICKSRAGIRAGLFHWLGGADWLSKAEDWLRKTSAPLIDGLDETALGARVGPSKGLPAERTLHRRSSTRCLREFSIFAVVVVAFVLLTTLMGVRKVPQGWPCRTLRPTITTRPRRLGSASSFLGHHLDAAATRRHEQVRDVPKQIIVTIIADGVAFTIKVLDARRASYEIANLQQALLNLVMTNIRTVSSMDSTSCCPIARSTRACWA